MRYITFCLILLSCIGCSSVEYRVYDSVYDYQYKTDLELYGVDEYWPTVVQFQASKKGDCDAYAGYFSEVLGVPVTIGAFRHKDGSIEGHAWVVSGGYIIDNTGVHRDDDPRYLGWYTLPDWEQAALIQQASLQKGREGRRYFTEQLAPLITLVN